MIITDVDFARAQRAWTCSISFRVKTRRQFTVECHSVIGHGTGHGIVGVVTSYLNARRHMSELCKTLRQIPGDFELA